jgi:hypothetical protein
MNPHSFTYFIFEKGTKNIQWRKESHFNIGCWEKWLSACRKLKLDQCLSPHTRSNSKWIKVLIIRPQTLQLVQERGGNILEAVGIGNSQ